MQRKNLRFFPVICYPKFDLLNSSVTLRRSVEAFLLICIIDIPVHDICVSSSPPFRRDMPHAVRVSLCFHLLHLIFFLLSGGTHQSPLLLYTSVSVQYFSAIRSALWGNWACPECAAREFTGTRSRASHADRSRGRARLTSEKLERIRTLLD